ncbi:hypothetical protein [Zhihengliuella halotolerans]|uniref:hypothetical protein n=1 Tax=Zhihengliuella halotolerans TaxID=370736 RepID=UPI000C809A6B|nr:hypothetical protein [Zhihengliuella halotolerans]
MDSIPRESKTVAATAYVGEALLPAIPVVGSSIAYVFGRAIHRKQEENLRSWLEDLKGKVDELEVEVGRLADDADFNETFNAAAAAAGRTAHQAKLVALRNAVLNSAMPGPGLENDYPLRFIRIIEEMVPDHLRLLTYADDPMDWFTSQNLDTSMPSASRPSLALKAMGWDSAQRDRLARLVEDLVAWRLVGTSMLKPTNGSVSGLLDGRQTTSDGHLFTQYVHEPEPLS